jgi:hypothetical protein
MAQCYYYLMDPVNAMTYFQRARRALGADIEEDTAADIADKIRRLEDKVARLVIDVNVDGATVEVDGARIGRSPILDPVYVLPGTVVVRASLRSGASAEERVVADRGRGAPGSRTLAGPGGGEYLDPPTAITGEDGTATTYLVSGPQPSMYRQVWVCAGDFEGLKSDTVKFTIAGPPAHITIRRNLGEITKYPATYGKQCAAIVTDINGNPVAG